MGKNKKVTNGKCLHIMQSDHIKRHMLQHEKDMFVNESICSSSLATSRSSLQEGTERDFS